MDYYTILGVSRHASFTEIKSRYRLLSKQHHPDVGGDQQHMAHLNQAYMILSDPLKRSSYDAAQRRKKVTTPPSRQPSPWPAPRPASQMSGQESIFKTPPIAHRHRLKGLRWTITAGLVSACLAVIGVVAMNGVSLANPGTTTEPADAPAPSIAVQIPEDSPIINSPIDNTQIDPDTNNTSTPESQPAATAQESTPADTTQDDSCKQKNFGSFTFSHCKTLQRSAACAGTNQGKEHFYTWCSDNKR